EDFFKYYGYFISSIFHLLKWAHMEMKAEDGSNHLKARSTHLSQIDFQYFNHVPEFRENFQELCESLSQVSEVIEIKETIKAFTRLSFPTIFTFTVDPLQGLNGNY